MANNHFGHEFENIDLSSPNHFPCFIAEDFLKGDFEQFGHDIIPQTELSQGIGETTENRGIDNLLNDSNSSTTYSSKHSPEYLDSIENPNLSDRKNEDDVMKHSKVPPILRKGIQKQYEAIIDNNVIYDYDNNPSEYKKARKRIQNRQSATRVRNKKKNYVEELENEMALVKMENNELKVQNATLRAENNLLRQQTCFLEKMVMKSGQQAMTNAPINQVTHNFEECLLPLVNKVEETPSSKKFGYFRVAPPHTFKKHSIMLGIFTILLCTYGFLSQGEENSNQAFYPQHINEFKNSFSLGLKSLNESTGGSISGYQMDLDQSLTALLKANQEYDSIKFFGKIVLIAGYVMYFIYVLLIANWKYVFRIKNKKVL